MSHVVRGLILPVALISVLTAAGRLARLQGFRPPPVDHAPAASYYYAPPAVAITAPPAVSTTLCGRVLLMRCWRCRSTPPRPCPTTPPRLPAATVTTRYGLFGRPRVTVAQYYAP